MISEEYREGDKLPTEPELMKEFGVSRSVLRESFKTLEARGLIISKQGSGRYVHTPNCCDQFTYIWKDILQANPSLMLELLELRSLLEINSLEQAMERVSVEQLQDLAIQVQTMKSKAKEGIPFVEEDKKFHTIMFKGAGNIFIEQLLISFWDLFEGSGIDFHHGGLVDVALQHEQILEAFTKHNMEDLRKLMVEQFADARYRIMVHLAKGPQTASSSDIESA